MTRNLYFPIINRCNEDSNVKINSHVLDELNFWQNRLDILSFRSVTSFYRVPERIMFVDASNFAGASVLLQNINRVSHAMFTYYEQDQSSTYRELRALEHALSS
jgi:hypothetical protein